MEKFTKLDNAIKENPDLLPVYTGEDETAALAAAQKVVPDITTEEFAIYRADREQVYPAMQSLVAVFQKVNSDAVFAAKIDSCEDFSDVYRLCNGIVSVSERRFASIYEQFRTEWDATHQADDYAELTDSELATVVGGANIWQKVGSWFKKNAYSIIGGVVGTTVGIATICLGIFTNTSSDAGETIARATESSNLNYSII